MKGFILQLVLGTPLLSNLLNITELFVSYQKEWRALSLSSSRCSRYLCKIIYRGTRHRYSGSTVAATSGTRDRYSDTAMIDVHLDASPRTTDWVQYIEVY